MDIKTNNPQFEKEKKDHEEVNKLINIQKQICPRILYELNNNGKKITHWIWYIFPTTHPGDNDYHKTYVTINTAQILLNLNLNFALSEWRLCLEKIIDLAIYNNNNLKKVLSLDDIGRVGYFIIFWQKIPNKPTWLIDVCEDLNNLIKRQQVKIRRPDQIRQISTKSQVQRSQPVQIHQPSTKPSTNQSKWLIQSDQPNIWLPALPWQEWMIMETIKSKKDYYAYHKDNGNKFIYLCRYNSPGNITLWNLNTRKERIVIHSDYGRPNHNGPPAPFGGMAIDLLSIAKVKIAEKIANGMDLLTL